MSKIEFDKVIYKSGEEMQIKASELYYLWVYTIEIYLNKEKIHEIRFVADSSAKIFTYKIVGHGIVHAKLVSNELYHPITTAFVCKG